jgi:hypothetical protein
MVMKLMRIIVPIALSLIATFVAVALTRLIRRADVDGDLEPLAGEWAAAPIG